MRSRPIRASRGRPRTSTSSARPATTRASSRISRTSATAVEIEDDRWLGKVFKGQYFFDVIFASSNGTMPIGDQWFENARQIEVFGSPVRIVGPTELVWSKCFIQLRHRYDGADVAHTILKAHDQIDWHAAARLHGSALGGAAHAPAQLPLDLSDRARQGPALGDGRASRPACPSSSIFRRRR